MATISQNNINFTNINADPIFSINGKFSRNQNDDGNGHFDTTLTENEIVKSFNAIEIDWNGAQLDSQTTINTTGQLISAIKWASLQGKDVVDGDSQYKLN